MDTIKITQQNKSYEQFYSLTVILTSLFTALTCQKNKKVIHNPPKLPIEVEGYATNKIIEFPVSGIIHEILKNIKRECIEIIIRDFAPSTHKYEKEITVLNSTIDSIFLPFLLDFYENYSEEAKLKFGDYESYPDSWRMAWVVRNAIAHGRKIHFKNNKYISRSWSGITISPNDNGRPLTDFFNFADLIILLLEMEKDLS